MKSNETIDFYPPFNRIKHHAKYISEEFKISLCHAQHWVARHYKMQSWADLKKDITASKNANAINSNLDVRYPFISHTEANWLRDDLLHHVNSCSENDSSLLSGKRLVPHTLSYALEKLRLDWISDENIALLCDIIYDDDDEIPVATFIEVVELLDDSLITHIEKLLYSKTYSELRFITPRLRHNDSGLIVSHALWIKDSYRFCDAYVQIDVHHEWLRVSLLELDFNYFSGGKLRQKFIEPNVVCEKPWFYEYVVRYILNLPKKLSQFGYSGQIIIEKINNMPLVTGDNAPRWCYPSPVMINKILRDYGAKEIRCSSFYGLCIDF